MHSSLKFADATSSLAAGCWLLAAANNDDDGGVGDAMMQVLTRGPRGLLVNQGRKRLYPHEEGREQDGHLRYLSASELPNRGQGQPAPECVRLPSFMSSTAGLLQVFVHLAFTG
jgi:hypothetical protein